MVNLREYIYSQYLLSKSKHSIVFNIDSNDYKDILNYFKKDIPFSGINISYSFDYLNNIFFANKRVKGMQVNNNEYNRLNIFIYDFDIFNQKSPQRTVEILEKIQNKYNNQIVNSNKILILSKPNVKIFDKNEHELSKRLEKIISSMNLIDVSRI